MNNDKINLTLLADILALIYEEGIQNHNDYIDNREDKFLSGVNQAYYYVFDTLKDYFEINDINLSSCGLAINPDDFISLEKKEFNY